MHIVHTGKISMQLHSVSTCRSFISLDEPLRMKWSISLTELTSGYGVNISYISGMDVFRVSTSFGFAQWKI